MISSLYYALNKYFKSCDILQIRCPTFLYIFLHKFSRNYIVSRMKRIFKKKRERRLTQTEAPQRS